MNDDLWKERFKESTTNIALNLMVSKKQAQCLAVLHEEEIIEEKEWISITPGFSNATFTSLERKGLIKHNGDKYVLSKAGKLVMDLLLLVYDKKELLKTHFLIKVEYAKPR